MIYLFDTNAVSDLMKDQPRIRERLALMRESDRAVVCPIVRGEILHGIQRLPAGRRRAELLRNATRVLGGLICEAIPEPAGDLYAALRTDCEAKGIATHENDLWIMATAVELGATIVSRDRDIQRLAAVQVEDWTL